MANSLGSLSYPGMPFESIGDGVDEYQVTHEGDAHQKEWNLLVVNDLSTANSWFVKFIIRLLSELITEPEMYCCVYRDITCLQR